MKQESDVTDQGIEAAVEAPVGRRTLIQRMAAMVGLSALSGVAPATAAAVAKVKSALPVWPSKAGPARIAPITPEEEASDKVRAYFAAMEGPGGRKGGTKLNLVLTLANYPELATRYHQFGMHVINFTSLPPRLMEIVTCRTAWLYRSDYEWTKHTAKARKLGVTEAEIEAISHGHYAGIFSPLETHALNATDQLHANTAINDATWTGLAQGLDEKQLLDLLFTVGSYAMLAMVLNGVRVQNET